MPRPASESMEIDFAIRAGISMFHLHRPHQFNSNKEIFLKSFVTSIYQKKLSNIYAFKADPLCIKKVVKIVDQNQSKVKIRQV